MRQDQSVEWTSKIFERTNNDLKRVHTYDAMNRL
jgi:hypothetical protein